MRTIALALAAVLPLGGGSANPAASLRSGVLTRQTSGGAQRAVPSLPGLIVADHSALVALSFDGSRRQTLLAADPERGLSLSPRAAAWPPRRTRPTPVSSWPGSRWWRCDLHVHTPRSHDFSGTNVTPSDLVDAAVTALPTSDAWTW